MSPNDKISHNVHTNYGPRVGFAYKVDDKTAAHGAFGIVYDNWAAVTQMVQNAEGSWPDIGNPDLSRKSTYPPVRRRRRPLPPRTPLGHGGAACTRLPPHLWTTIGSSTPIIRMPILSSGTSACSGSSTIRFP